MLPKKNGGDKSIKNMASENGSFILLRKIISL